MFAKEISIPVTYKSVWLDGFGARGWKLDVSIGAPSVIAATAEHGTRIATSVLVHDILDHHLCGFEIGGHRNEAMALIQLASRTGADPRQDFRQIVEEDLMRGHCNGEPLRSFLPQDLVALLPDHARDDRDIINFLSREFGKDALQDTLVDHFVTLGASVQYKVELHWLFMGLDYKHSREMGLALQHLLVQVDQLVREQDWEQAHGWFSIGNQRCAIELDMPVPIQFTARVDDPMKHCAEEFTP
jgi:hypothetical protein